jgi:hypothetical protein
MSQQITESSDERNEQALDALERLLPRQGQFETCSASTEEARAPTTRRADRDPARSAALRGRGQGRQGRSPRTRHPRRAGDEPTRRRSLDRVYLRNGQWKELADVLASDHDHRAPRRQGAHTRAQVPLGQVKEQHSRRPGAIDRTRHPRHRRGTSARARSRPHCGTQHKLTSRHPRADLREAGRVGPLVGVHEISSWPAEKDSLAQDVAAPPHRRVAAHEAASTPRRRSMRTRAAFKARPRQPSAARSKLEAIAPLIEGRLGPAS